jgi:dolichyl-phosphate-mannose-protein mannosyltransferase
VTGSLTATDVAVAPPAAEPRPPERSLRDRLTPPMPSDRVMGWVVPLVIAAVAGVLRFWRLSVPQGKVFDEVYYATYAHKMLGYGVVYDAAQHQPEYIVHPPIGNWMIALGEWFFGYNSFGWRVAPALCGTLSVLMIGRIGRRMFRSTLLGGVAAALLALDGLAYVLSRSALLDGLLMFWLVAAFGTLLLDRDHSRARLAALVERDGVGRWGPRLGLRPWRLATGVLLGLACGTKWNGLYMVAAFGLAGVLWDLGARRAAGVRRPLRAVLLRDALPAVGAIVGVALVVYVASWTGWFLSDKGWDRQWAATHPSASYGWVPDAVRSLWHYHAQMWQFHSTLHTPHPYQSNPWSWLILGRPVMFFYEGPTTGAGCSPTLPCAQAITALGNPAIWWASLGALPVVLWRWVARRDWRAGAILMGVTAGYLPWFAFQRRTIFSFYAIAFTPWIVLAVTMCVGLVVGRAAASSTRRAVGAAAAGAYLLIVALTFFHYLPVLSGEVISSAHWGQLMRFKSWI